MKLLLRLFMRKLALKKLDNIIYSFEANQGMDRMVSLELEIPLSQVGMFLISR